MDQNNDNKRTPLHLESALEPAATGGQHSSNSNDTSSLEFILSLFTTWWNDAMWPGLGLFGESYILFSLGLLKPFWATLYPDCFDDDETLCSTNLLNSITYSVVLGVICGMLLLGYAANRIGRRKGSILTASFMAGGSIGLSLSSFIFANNPKLLFQTMSVLLFVFGVGVGGEYPMSSSTATEKAMGEMNNRLKNELEREAQRSANRMHTSSCIDSTTFDPKTAMHHMYAQQQHDETNNSNNTTTKRGRAVQLVFLSQGTGIMANSLILVFLLLMFGQYGDNVAEVGYSPDALLAIWRIVYSIGAIVLIFVLVSRVAYLQESNVWTDDKGRRAKLNRTAVVEVEFEHLEQAPALAPSLSMVSSLSTPSTVMIGEASTMSDFMYSPPGNEKADVSATPVRLLIRYFGVRMFGSSLAWLLWDIAFYGNKLFQSTFLLAIMGADTSLLQLSVAAALNAFVALLGYIGAAILLDHPQAGRLRLQQYGFLITGALFVGCGFLYDKISSGWLVLMYFASSFVGQLGPNATTFLIPAEIFPTEMRTLCHGAAAASGKIGALIAAIAFNYIGEGADMFLLSGYASFAACVVTFWSIPDVTTLDLYELDRQWRLTLEGRRSAYVGDANKPEYLSHYERTQRGMYY